MGLRPTRPPGCRGALPLLCAALAAILLSACAGKKEEPLRGVEYYHREGMDAFERKRYLKAVEMFQRVVSNFPGSALVAEAQFHLAEAYFGMEDFVNAVFEYQRLVDSYPHSGFVERAQFQIAESHFMQMRSPEHDQEETYEALTHFRRFIEDNPDSPLLEEARNRIVSCRSQLAKKQYLAGRFYQKQGYLEAAGICFGDLLLTYPETRWYCWGKAMLGDLALGEGDHEAARMHWSEVMEECEEEELRGKVEEWLEEVGGAGSE